MSQDKPHSQDTTVTGASTPSEWSTSTYAPTLDVPNDILECIGSINIHWALAEYILAGMQYQMLSLNRKEGRIYDQEPRLRDVTETITKIGKMRGLEFPFEKWESFTGTLSECDRLRNLYDHCVWFQHETDGLCIQDTRGIWPKGDPRHPLSKKTAPGHTPISIEKVRSDLKKIEDALSTLRIYSMTLERALRKK